MPRLFPVMILLFAGSAAAAGPPFAKPVVIPRLDAEGFPLPPGAAARLGSARFLNPFLVADVALSPDGKTVYTCGRDGWGKSGGGVRAWDIATGKPRWTVRRDGPLLALAVTADGRQLRVVGGSHGGGDKTVAAITLDANTGREVAAVRLGEAKDVLVAPSRDGSRLAVYDRGSSRSVRLYDLPSGRVLQTWTLVSPSNFNSFSLSADGRRLAATTFDKLLVFDADTGLSQPLPEPPNMSAAAFSPDGKTVAAIGRSRDNQDELVLTTWDVGTSQKTGHAPVGPRPDARYWHNLHYAPDGKSVLVLGVEASPVFLDPLTGATVGRLDGPGGSGGYMSRTAAWSADGRTLVLADSGISVWDLPGGRRLVQSAESSTGYGGMLTFSQDSSILAVRPPSGDDYIAWNLSTRKEVERHRWATARERGLGTAESGSGSSYRRLSVRSPDGTLVARYAPGSGIQITDAASGVAVRTMSGSHSYGFDEMGFSGDGRYVVAAGGGVRGWAVETGRPTPTLKNSDEMWRTLIAGPAMYPAPVGSLVAIHDLNQHSGDGSASAFSFGVYDIATARQVARFSGINPLCRLAWSADGSRIAGVMIAFNGEREGGLVCLADVSAGKFVLPPHPLPGPAHGVTLSPDGRTAALRAKGGVELREGATGKVRHTFPARNTGFAAAFSPDGRWLASAGGESGVLLWSLRDEPAARPDLDRLWADLGVDDAAGAYRAVRALIAVPAAAVPLLRDRLPPAAPPDRDRVARLITDLDAKSFPVREEATRQLRRMRDLIQPELRAVLTKSPSAEARRRAELLLAGDAAPPEPDDLRAVRAVEAAEGMGTAESRKLLEAWAAGADGARLTREAAAALKRRK